MRCTRFLGIKQDGTINDYLHKFKELLAPLPEIAKDVLVGNFTNRLDPVIKTEVFAVQAVGP